MKTFCLHKFEFLKSQDLNLLALKDQTQRFMFTFFTSVFVSGKTIPSFYERLVLTSSAKSFLITLTRCMTWLCCVITDVSHAILRMSMCKQMLSFLALFGHQCLKICYYQLLNDNEWHEQLKHLHLSNSPKKCTKNSKQIQTEITT